MAVAPPTPRVLVVDDEEAVRNFVARVLRDAGYDVNTASLGPEALQRVDEQKAAFDGFVVDLMMPDMSGDELARRLRQSNPDVRVLYLTGYADRLFKDKVTLWEHEAFVEKPVSVKGLLEAVSMLLFGHTRGPQKATA